MQESIRYVGNTYFSVHYNENFINTMPHFHSHQHYEMYCLTSGTRTLFIDKTTLRLYPGSVVIIAPNTLHRFVDDAPGDAYARMLFNYKPECMPDFLTKVRGFNTFVPESYYYFKNVRHPDYLEHITTIKHALTKIDNLYEFSIYSSFLQVLIILANENFAVPITPKKSLNSKNLIELVSLYISTHLEDDLSLNTLANKFFVSPSHLSRRFKETTNIPLSTFINEQKVQRAIWLLEEYNHPLSVIAKQSGFTSISSFNRTFKTITNHTPSEYRNALKNNKNTTISTNHPEQ